jgi:hypothetical protein
MNRKIIYSVSVLAVAALAAINIQLELNEHSVAQVLKLNSTEALSACEVSSTPSNNNGYCVPKYGNPGGDSCVIDGESYHVRCSGNS